MTVQPTPGLGRRQRRFISPRLSRMLAGVTVLIGVVAPIGGIAYAINGATQAPGPVKVRVVVTQAGGLQAPVTGTAGGGTLPLHPQSETEGDPAVSLFLVIPAAASSSLEVPRELTFRAWDSTITEQVLSRGAAAVLGLCVGLGAFLLRRILLAIGDGQPFQPGNPTRLAGIAGLMVVASLAAAVLPAVASARVLDRLGLGDAAASPVAGPPVNLDLGPLLVALAVLALAEAFRRGGELARDVEGLI